MFLWSCLFTSGIPPNDVCLRLQVIGYSQKFDTVLVKEGEQVSLGVFPLLQSFKTGSLSLSVYLVKGVTHLKEMEKSQDHNSRKRKSAPLPHSSPQVSVFKELVV